MPPKCENCLIPKEQRCKPVKKTLGQCLKAVNQHVEPDISMQALKTLVGDGAKPIQQFTNANDDLPPSISEMLVQYDDFKFRVRDFTALENSEHQTIAFLVQFKNGDEVIFRP